MVQAYRTLAAEMYKLGWDYPMHLGVTEAGEGEDGRMKSAIGIGSLLVSIGLCLSLSLSLKMRFMEVSGSFSLYYWYLVSCGVLY